jgi:Leucine-rich repeat (LRR) protein
VSYNRAVVSLEFLKHLVDLKFLKLTEIPEFPNEVLISICWLRNLESLELVGGADDVSGLKYMHRLKKLKRLVVNEVSANILEHLKFGIFDSLEELDACFFNDSKESVREMKRITPKLNKLTIRRATSKKANILLETLENLESVNIHGNKWKMGDKVYPKIKHLGVECLFFKFSAEQLSKQFPNLKILKILRSYIEVTELFIITLLRRMKQLKTLHLGIASESELDPESFLQCFQQYIWRRLIFVFGTPI